jgi:MarR family transcriptional regulator for hemolysin
MDPDLNPHAALAYLLDHVAAMLARQSDQALQEQLGIGMSQYKILLVLQRTPDIPQRTLADHLGQTEASISRQIKLMHDKGLLTNRVDPNNRRVHIAELTSKGEKITEAARAVLLRHGQPIFGALTDKQQKQLVETLRLLHDATCSSGKPISCDRPFEL